MRNLLAAGLLVVFGVYYSNVTLFYHTHIINGVTIVHSHSHAQHHHDSKDGGHTVVQLTLIAQLTSQLLMMAAHGGSGLMALHYVITQMGEQQSLKVSNLSLDGFLLRAPPVLVKMNEML